MNRTTKINILAYASEPDKNCNTVLQQEHTDGSEKPEPQ